MGFLPNITLKPDCDPKLFLNRMEGLGNQSNLIQEVLRDTHLGVSAMDILAFMPLDQNGHVEIIGQFIHYYNKPLILSVEVRARAWSPDPPNYESYVKVLFWAF